MRQTKAKRWRIEPGDETIEQELVRELGVYPVVAKLLVNRGITTVTAGRDFFIRQSGRFIGSLFVERHERSGTADSGGH